MKYPFERQNDLKDCGVCSLLMLVRYYGGGVSKEYLRNLTNTTKSGVSAYSLIEGAKTLGFDSFGVKSTIEDLDRKHLPCIAHVVIKKSYQHFVVIYKIDKKKKIILLADPSKNKLTKMSFEEFSKISTNQFILLQPKKKIMYIKKNTILKNYIQSFIIHNSKKILFLFFLSLIFTVFNILNSFHIKILIEFIINYKNLNNLLLISLMFIGIIIVKETSNYCRNLLINQINHQLDKNLFSHVYHHILSLPYLYYKNRTTGEIISRMEDLSSVRNVISKLLVTILLDLLLAIFTFFTLLFLNVKLTIILIISILLSLIIVIIFRSILENKIVKSKEESAKLNSFLIETISGIETVKNQNIQSFVEDNFLLKYSKYNRNSFSYNNLFVLEQFFKNIISECGTFLVITLGSYLVVKNELDFSILLTFITLMNYLL